ncbi:MAG: SMC-Scp complex subunit ScpB [Candidatus Omnitrophica bacterium]|nr:SMC-Scp complex subunit ScpB [Candidatus Omnitrophota bacterium]
MEMDTSAQEYLKGAIEALLFISEKPVLMEQIAEVMQESVGPVDVKKLVEEIREEYETKQRGMVIVEVAGGYQMLSSPHYVSYVRSFLKTKVKEKLSRPALETLAIVAYKQPVSRGDIEVVRGVNSDGVVLHLLNKSLIKIVGKKDVAGRPFLYGTTKLFLEYFGLKSLRDLPKLEDVSLLLANAEQAAAISAEGAPEGAASAPQEEVTSEASRALDAAEAEAAKANPESSEEIISPEPVEASEPVALKEAMEDINRGDIQAEPEVPSSRLSEIVAEESAAAEQAPAPSEPEGKDAV